MELRQDHASDPSCGFGWPLRSVSGDAAPCAYGSRACGVGFRWAGLRCCAWGKGAWVLLKPVLKPPARFPGFQGPPPPPPPSSAPIHYPPPFKVLGLLIRLGVSFARVRVGMLFCEGGRTRKVCVRVPGSELVLSPGAAASSSNAIADQTKDETLVALRAQPAASCERCTFVLFGLSHVSNARSR